jgi:hypothetical protein
MWIAPGIKHWHGASPTNGMSHVAIAWLLDGSAVQWLEQVSDEDYAKALDYPSNSAMTVAAVLYR